VSLYFNAEEADKAQSYFESVIGAGARPADEFLEVLTVPSQEIRLLDLVKEAKFFATTGEARDAIGGGALKIDDIAHKDGNEMLILKAGESFILQAGKKKFKKIVVK